MTPPRFLENDPLVVNSLTCSDSMFDAIYVAMNRDLRNHSLLEHFAKDYNASAGQVINADDECDLWPALKFQTDSDKIFFMLKYS